MDNTDVNSNDIDSIDRKINQSAIDEDGVEKLFKSYR